MTLKPPSTLSTSLIRLAWLAIVALKLVVFFLGLSYFYVGQQQVCAVKGDACWDQGGLLAIEVQTLADAGWSVQELAAIGAINEVVVLVLTVGIGALIFW